LRPWMNDKTQAESPAEVKRKRTRSPSPPYISALNSLIRAPRPVTPTLPSRRLLATNRRERRRRPNNVETPGPVPALDSDGGSIEPTRSKRHPVPDEEIARTRSRPTNTPSPSCGSPRALSNDGCVFLSKAGAADSGIFLLNREITVTGTADLKVLLGAVTVLSHVLTAQSRLARIHSDLGPFVITFLPVGLNCDEDALSFPSLERDFEMLLSKHLTACAGAFAVVEISAVDRMDRGSVGIDPFKTYITLPLNAGVRTEEAPGSTARHINEQVQELVPGFWILGAAKVPKFSQWHEWPLVANALSFRSEMADASHDQRIIVCGESGTGKSMLARCIANHLLNTWMSIVYVETDVGQPELTPAGLVSAHVLTSPLLGPPASHNQTVPLTASFFGDITPRENPCGYALAVSRIIEKARSYALSHTIPLVCNSDGWVSGTGARLLDHVVEALEPTHVFCSRFRAIPSSSTTCGVPLPEVLRVTLGRVPQSCSTQVESPLSARDCRFSSSALRDLGFAAYFGSKLSEGAVHCVKLEDINIAFIGEAVPGTHVLGALNGSVVAMASTLGVADSLHWHVYGLGLVRAVNPIDHTLHLCTPLPSDVLARCDGLQMSPGIQAPALLYYACADTISKGKTDALPYLTRHTLGKFGAMRSRTTLRR
jgi:hypothetical protein